MINPLPKAAIGLLAALLLGGCAGTSPPTRFYVLEAPVPAQAAVRHPELSLGLGPLSLPDTLDRPQIVTRAGPYSLELAEFHRWGGNLKANMSRLLAARLSQNLGTEKVFLGPWPRHRHLDYQIRIEVSRFDGRLGGEAVLQGNWTLLDGEGRKELAVHAFDLRQSVEKSGYGGLVEVLSGLVLRLGDEIGEEVGGRLG